MNKINYYYIEEDEICLDFTLTGEGLDDYLDSIYICNRSLSIKDTTTQEAQEWKQVYDYDTGFSSRTYPGGHFIYDPQNGRNEYIDRTQL